MDEQTRKESLENLRVHFRRFDTDGNGYIDLAEFREVLRSLGEDPPSAVVELNFSVIDTNEDGVVNFTEFSNWWLDR